MFLILYPIIFVGVGRVYHLGDDLVVGLEDQNGARVLVLATVVSGRKNCDQCSAREALEAVHYALVGANNHVEVVFGEEALDPVGAKLDDIASFRRIPQMVRIYSQLAVGLSRV